ncbi:MAG: phosphonate metabolism protein/1,5-bisphosphokinase (PRPP-forming) PhnN [Pseudomonadota bacterium]
MDPAGDTPPPAATGRLVLVVGPSGAGKDTLLDRARAALEGRPGLRFAQRSITRPADAGGEVHEALSEAAFDARLAEGGFFAHWQAHGLRYGLPAAIADWLAAGETVVANGSRAAAPAIAARCAVLEIVVIDASPEVVAGRLAARGRESAAEIAARRARSVPPPPEGVPVRQVLNDTTPEAGAEKLVAAILGSPPEAPGLTRPCRP